MIVKEHQAAPTADRLQRAGDAAEQQMAFYLRRAFGTDPNVHVFHNLRFVQGEDAAQIDHLILHRSGAVIVESKSVTSAVRINEREEWARQWNGHWAGMPSPVLQAKRQADFLRSLLDAHKEDLLGKVLFGLRQKSFRAFMIDVVVAISDQGIVQHRGKLPEVRKADQVPDRVKELIADHVQLAHPLSKDQRADRWGVTMTPEEFARLSAFLRAKHTPKERPSAEEEMVPAPPSAGRSGRHGLTPLPQAAVQAQPEEAPPAPATRATASPSCRHCHSPRINVMYGKYGYYFKCLDCEGNTPIQLTCPTCGGKARTRKAGDEFFSKCERCSTSTRYHRNMAVPR